MKKIAQTHVFDRFAQDLPAVAEVGPGEVLTKLMKRIAPEAEAMSTSTVEGVQRALERLA